jgi:hypothetical protein
MPLNVVDPDKLASISGRRDPEFLASPEACARDRLGARQVFHFFMTFACLRILS